MTTEEAIAHLTDKLKTDPGYRYGWQSNITTAFCDAAARYKKQSGKVYLSAVDIHRVANEAANDFINQLCKNY